jgi:hypothetical protein
MHLTEGEASRIVPIPQNFIRIIFLGIVGDSVFERGLI